MATFVPMQRVQHVGPLDVAAEPVCTASCNPEGVLQIQSYCQWQSSTADRSTAFIVSRCLLVRNGDHFEVESLSEFGTFGTFLCRGSEVLINQESGHLVRTKVHKFPFAWTKALHRWLQSQKTCLLISGSMRQPSWSQPCEAQESTRIGRAAPRHEGCLQFYGS